MLIWAFTSRLDAASRPRWSAASSGPWRHHAPDGTRHRQETDGIVRRLRAQVSLRGQVFSEAEGSPRVLKTQLEGPTTPKGWYPRYTRSDVHFMGGHHGFYPLSGSCPPNKASGDTARPETLASYQCYNHPYPYRYLRRLLRIWVPISLQWIEMRAHIIAL